MSRSTHVTPAIVGSTPRRSIRRLLAIASTAGVLASAIPVIPAPFVAAAPTPCGDPGCEVTVDAHDLPTGGVLDSFTFIVNDDNTKSPDDPLVLSTESHSPLVATGDQDDPTVVLPDGKYLISVRSLDHKMWGAYVTLPDDATDGALSVRVDLTAQTADNPLPLGKIRVFVFNDNAWANGAPDTEEGGLGCQVDHPAQCFQIGLEEQTGSAVTVDYNNDPLCGGVCVTGPDGFAEVDNLGPATYFIDVHTPDSCDPNDPTRSGPGQWYQTTTIDGGLQLLASVEEGSDGTGSPGEQLWEAPNNRTAYWFGFVCSPMDFAGSGTGEVIGQARNWAEWAPYTFGTFTDTIENPFVALSDSATDRTVFVGQGDGAGNFDIQGVPAGNYNLSIWDEQLSYIMRFKDITVAAGQTVDTTETGDDGSQGVGVSRWFGWLDGHVYKDLNRDGKFDECTDGATPSPTTCDLALGDTDVDQRWRDGSIKEATFTDPTGYYEYPTAEGGALGRWFINEQGFSRFSADPGASTIDEITGAVVPSCLVGPSETPANPCVPNTQGGGLLANTKVLEGHRLTVDWGKHDYEPGAPGQIVGVTYWATTRNEFNAALQAHEDYEPGIPNVKVLLEMPGPDGLPNTSDDIVVNNYNPGTATELGGTDHWVQPSSAQDPQDDGQGGPNSTTQNCDPIRTYSNADVTSQFNPKIGPNCLEVPLGGAQSKEGAFDGGYAFATYCPNGYDMAVDDGSCIGGTDPVDLVTGTYITHVIMPTDPNDDRPCNPVDDHSGYKDATGPFGDAPDAQKGCLYRIVREEDVNVDLGNNFGPAIPPPPCVGDEHVLEQATLVTRSPYFGHPASTAKLCDKRLIELVAGQNANADFNLMTNFPTDPNGSDASDTRTGDVSTPGRLVGQVFNDIYFETDPKSPWYGEPRPIGGIPVGIYARVDTVPTNLNCPAGYDGTGAPNDPANCFDANRWRLLTTLTTSPDGSFEALVPSTETFNCPIPQGPCPGMYLITVDDPGSAAHANAKYNPNLLLATTPAEAWPGLTTQLDLPLDPISGTACEDPAAETGPARPALLQVSRPYVMGNEIGAARQVTIYGDFIGTAGAANATGGRVTLTDVKTGVVTTLTRAAGGGIVSWTPGSGSIPDTIVIQVPPVSGSFTPGPKQVTLVTANANGGVSSVNGITLHVLYGSTTVPVSRVDAGATINNGTRVYDPGMALADQTGMVGAGVSGPGIPAGTTITSATFTVAPAGRFFTMTNPATATASNVSLTINLTRTDPSASRTSGSLIVRDPAILLADTATAANGGLIGRSVTGSGIPAGATVTAVNFAVLPANRTFTLNAGHAATSTGTSPVTFTFTRTDTGTSTNNGTLVLDSAITAADVTATVTAAAPGGIPAGTTITTVTPGVSFVMSAPATQTGTRNLTIASTASVTPYDPTIVSVPAPTPSSTGLIQAAVDGAAPGSLVVLSPGTYNENVLLWKPLKLQGLGPGGIIGAHELAARDPEDPRFDIQGSVIDGRFFQEGLTAYEASIASISAAAPAGIAGVDGTHPVLKGADITVVAKTPTAYDLGATTGILDAARIDGLGLVTGHGEGAGGIQLQAYANNQQITNDVLEGNGGVVAGGIGIGQPFPQNTSATGENHNFSVRVANSRLIGNGGLVDSGGIGLFTGSNNYEIARSILCSNYSVNYGAGISHLGLSPGGSIHDNQIYYNESFDAGAGLSIQSELPVGGGLGDGTGALTIDRNLIQSNYSNDDGGGIFILDALQEPISIRNNMIVDNGAADLGGAILLDDSSNVRIINNTIANNISTASAEDSDGLAHGAGLTSEANDPLFQSMLPAGSPQFSNPRALFNNIFWNNNAFTLSSPGPGATLVNGGFIDFEIHGTTNNADTFTPRFSLLTNGQIQGPNGVLHALPVVGQANIVGADPLFVAPFILEPTVTGSRGDPQTAAVTITGADPPVSLTGDYHLNAGSPATDRGAGYSNLAAIPPLTQTPNAGTAILAPCGGTAAQSYPADFDRQTRPNLRVNNQVRTPWDIGADELPGAGTPAPRTLVIPGSYTQGPDATFNWNGGAAQLQCAASTELR